MTQITSASAARKMVDVYDPEKDPILDSIMSTIRDRASRGYYDVSISNFRIPEELISYLKGIGYTAWISVKSDLCIDWKIIRT